MSKLDEDLDSVSDKPHITINHKVFWVPFIALLLVVILNIASGDVFRVVVTTAFTWVIQNVGWAFSLTTTFFVFLLLAVLFSPLGKIKFGGEKAKPEISTWNWFCIALCAGVGIGLVFWGVSEPIYHLANVPPEMGKPFSKDAILFSMETIFLHWTFVPYGLYVICALPIALAFYNYNKPFRVSSGLYFLIGDRCQGIIGTIVDSVVLFSVAGVLANSLGLGIMQLASGVQYITGINPNKIMWVIITIVVVGTYTVSSYTGINKGIKWFSSQNTKLFIFILAFVFLLGPTVYILDLGVESFGYFLSNFVGRSLWVGAGEASSRDWMQSWTYYYWPDWMGFAPIIGMFLARIVYGRTVRQFILMNLIAPSLFGMVWFIIFGGAAIHMQQTGTFDIWKIIQERGLESSLFAFLEQFPFAVVIIPIFILTIAVSFITMGDGMTTCIANLSSKGYSHKPESIEANEPPVRLRIAWGVIIGVIALVFILFEGTKGAKMLATLTGFPAMFLLVALSASIIKVFFFRKAKLNKSTLYYKELYKDSDEDSDKD